MVQAKICGMKKANVGETEKATLTVVVARVSHALLDSAALLVGHALSIGSFAMVGTETFKAGLRVAPLASI